MKVNLSLNNFNAIKVVLSAVFLLICSIFPVLAIYSIIILIVGKAHTLGAWISMWRAKKLNWKYVIWVGLIITAVSYWAVVVATIWELTLAGYLLFAFHFIYDEFEIEFNYQKIADIVLSSVPFILLTVYILDRYTELNINFAFYLGVFIFSKILDLFFVKELNWSYLNSNFLSLFILSSIFLEKGATFVVYTFLVYHYFFWFAFPLYKLHLRSPEERDEFIMMLLIIVFMSVFVYSAVIWGDTKDELNLRTFFVASIAHILTTSPFGYLIGLKRKKQDVQIA